MDMLTQEEQEQILVTVIVPTYKRAGLFLVKTVNSLLNQSHQHIEVLVVDDNVKASLEKDSTKRLMEAFSHEPRVRFLIKENNSGGSKSRNYGIEHARGDYITFLDDDDLYRDKKIEKQLAYMVKNNLDMCFTDFRIHNSKNQLIDFRSYKDIKAFDQDSLLRYHLTKKITGTASFMYRKESLLAIDMFDTVKVGQEFVLMLKTIEADLKIGYLDSADVIQFIHEGEKVSKGKGKVEGEKYLYQLKRQYFNRLSFRERQFVKFRYHLVMFVVGIQDRRPLYTIKEFLLCFCSSPLDFVIEVVQHFKRVLDNRQLSKK